MNRESMRRQIGFSLTELMVALVLGLFLLAGVGQVYLGSKRSYNTQAGMSLVQENGRIGMHFLQRTIRLAGLYSDPLTDPAFLYTNSPATSRPITGTDGATAADPDSISVRYVCNSINCSGILDCLGAEIPDNSVTPITVTFSLTAPVAGVRSLQCNSGAGNQPLIEGVSNLDIRYGIDTTPADINDTANQYVNAATVTNWTRVRSVRIVLTADSTSVTDTAPVTQLFTTTIALRNRM